MTMFVQIRPEEYSKRAFAQFSATRGAFDLGDALAMMWMSQLAYETDMKSRSTIVAVGPHWGFHSIEPLRAASSRSDSRAIVGLRNDCTVVAFAGTDPGLLRNLITDTRFSLSPANTHSGFQDGVDRLWGDVEARVRNSPRPLFFTGHSLGAALAAITAERAFDAGMPAAAVYGFGMPRAGGPDFAARYNGKLGLRTFRLVHGGDVVSRVPDGIVDVEMPGALLAKIQFRHVGRLLACASGAKFDRGKPLQDMTSNDPRFVEGVLTNLRARINAFMAGDFFSPAGPGVLGRFWVFLPFAIRDHLPDRYWAALTP